MGESDISYFQWSIFALEHPDNERRSKFSCGDAADFLSAARQAGAEYKKLKAMYPTVTRWKIRYFTINTDGVTYWLYDGVTDVSSVD